MCEVRPGAAGPIDLDQAWPEEESIPAFLYRASARELVGNGERSLAALESG